VTRGQQLAVTVTCLAAALTYAGAVTTWAMSVFVLPGVAGAALLATPLAARGMSGMAIGVVGALVLGWAELANVWTGTANGPAARSTGFAAGWTVIAVVLAHSRWPAAFLAGVAGVVAGAVVLGAAGEVRIVVVAAAVCAALTLGWIERSHRNWTARPRRGIALVLLSLLAGAAAAGAVLLQAQEDPRDPALVTLQGRQYPGIKPAWTDPLATASNSLGGTAVRHRTNPEPKPPTLHPKPQTPRHAPRPAAKPSHPASAEERSSRSIWFYVAAAIVLLVLILAALMAARLLSTRLAWRRVRRRLAAGAAADQVTGAWAWTRMRLEACRLPLAVDVSPDVALATRARLAAGLKRVAEELAKRGYPTDDVRADVYSPLQALAAAATTAAFAPAQSLGAVDAAAAWAAAEKADESARELLSRSARARLAFRRPAVAPSKDEEVVPAGRRLTTTQAIIMAACGLVACVATLVGLGVVSSGNGAVRIVSTLTKRATAAVSTSPPTVKAATTPRHAQLAPAPAPSQTPLTQGHVPSEAPVAPAQAPSKVPVSQAQAPAQTLAPGDTGSQVTILQRALAALGFSAGTPDGNYGLATQTAVARFQASQGLPQVGIVGPQTLAALRHALRHAPVSPAQAPSQTLAPGDTGSQVEILQRALAALGFPTGTPDGDYGPATQTAVARFQASQGLAQVGAVGPQTLAALQHALSRRSRR
jgi:peptidoglycan hydrolase-like protein with peptidoglycan-binding domain